jgi:hypothetical protein
MKLSKAQAGQLGGKATSEKYGPEYMRELARRGAAKFHERYRLEPYGTSDFMIVNRATGVPTGKTVKGYYWRNQ